MYTIHFTTGWAWVVVFLLQIWKVCDPNYTNSFGRDQLYKSLALVALAQQGKPLDEKVLLNYADKGN